jgi:cytochrome c oxidase subunit III
MSTAIAEPRTAWEGGISPFGIGWSKLMMWLFIVTDGLIFAGFLAVYGFTRVANPNWPDRSRIFHLDFIALMTFTLITSSATMASAVAAARAGRKSATRAFLALTILGGAAFLSIQAYEWTHLIREGATLHTNPWGAASFGACFFLMTGFHGSHVLSGVVVLATTLVRNAMGRAEGVELAGLYWHFVDLVWVFIFTLFYLL